MYHYHISCVTFIPLTLAFFYLTVIKLHRETSILAGELPEESDQFRFFRVGLLVNLQVKTSVMRVTIPIDFPTRSFIPLPRFFNSRRTPPILTPSLILFPQQSVKVKHGVRSL